MLPQCLGFWFFGILFNELIFVADGFSKGAPANTCWTRYPKHKGQGTQTTKCPFHISVFPESYRLGEEITVTIADPSGNRTFSGFQIAAYRYNSQRADTDLTPEVVGTFTQLPQNVSAITCFPGFQNMATHEGHVCRSEVVMKWQAPSENVGDLMFRATIVADFDRFWTREEKALPVDKSVTSPVVVAKYETANLVSIVKGVDYSECGATRSCVLYPGHCSGDDCISAVSFQYREATGDIQVEMFSDASKNYVAVGFSDDTKMGGEETFACVSQGGEMSIQHGWNPAYYNELLLTASSVSESEIRHADGRLQCRFVIQPNSQVYRINQSAPSLEYTNLDYNKDSAWYIQLAWGKSMPESNVMSYHKEMPMVSYDKVHIKQPGTHRGSAYPAIVKAHAAVMMIAWIFLGGLVTVVARHYRNWLSEKRVFGTKLWFQIHREIAITVAVLTIIGVLLIFSHYQWEIRKKSIPHSYVGIAVTVAVGLQILGGMLRPDAEHKLRPIFNWAHRFLGQLAHILAAVTMFLAFDIEYITEDMKLFGKITLGIWVAVQIFCHLAFEFLKWKRKGGSFDISGKGDGNCSLDTILLCIYILILASLCIACLLAFLLF